MSVRDIMLVAVSVIAAVLLIFRFSKENKICIVLGALCLLYGGYYTCSRLMPDTTFVTVFAWVLRAAALAAAVATFIVLRRERAMMTNSGKGTEDDREE